MAAAAPGAAPAPFARRAGLTVTTARSAVRAGSVLRRCATPVSFARRPRGSRRRDGRARPPTPPPSTRSSRCRLRPRPARRRLSASAHSGQVKSPRSCSTTVIAKTCACRALGEDPLTTVRALRPGRRWQRQLVPAARGGLREGLGSRVTPPLEVGLPGVDGHRERRVGVLAPQLTAGEVNGVEPLRLGVPLFAVVGPQHWTVRRSQGTGIDG